MIQSTVVDFTHIFIYLCTLFVILFWKLKHIKIWYKVQLR